MDQTKVVGEDEISRGNGGNIISNDGSSAPDIPTTSKDSTSSVSDVE